MKANKITKSILTLLFILVLSVQLVGCGEKSEVTVIQDMEEEEVVSFSFDFIGGKDVMPIVGYFGPYETSYTYNGNVMPDYLSDEMFQLIKDTGINAISASNIDFAKRTETAKRYLTQAEKYGIGVTMRDSRLTSASAKEMPLATVDSCINEYANYPSFIMCYLRDEPFFEKFNGKADGANLEDYSDVAQAMNNLGFPGYGNLFPMISGTKDGYEDYARAMATEWKVPFLSYDYYPFDSNKGLETAYTYFENMSIVRKVAEEQGITFWCFVQAGAQWNDGGNYRDSEGYWPSQGEFFWNVGTSLAFGAKGIQYFPLIQPYYFSYAQTNPHDFQRNGLIGAYGNTTRWYYYAQKMNAQIAAVDEILMNSVNKGVIASGKKAQEDLKISQYLLEGTSWRQLKDVQGDALIGCFNYDGKTALYVVNYDVEYAQKITLNFTDTYDFTVIQDAKESTLSQKNLQLTLSAGNSALIVFE